MRPCRRNVVARSCVFFRNLRRVYFGCNSDNRSVWRSRPRFETVRNSILIAGSARVQSISM